MRKRNLAEWLNPAEQPEEKKVQPPEHWNQEELKLRNERREFESAQEKIQRLVPGLNPKRLVL